MIDNLDLMTSAQVTACLKISRVTLWRMRQAGKLNPIKIGPLVRYRRDEIEQFIRDSNALRRAEAANE